MKWLPSIIVFAVASSGSGAGAQDAPSQARADLAPTGKLRVALLPLPHIAVRDKETGQFSGVVVDLSRELAKRLNVPVEFVTVNSNSVAVDRVKNGQADLTLADVRPNHWSETDARSARSSKTLEIRRRDI